MSDPSAAEEHSRCRWRLGLVGFDEWLCRSQADPEPLSANRMTWAPWMRGVAKALVVLQLLWNVAALAQQPAPYLPDPELTPGDVFDVTVEDVCTPGYARKVRAVPRPLRHQAFATYGISSDRRREYQLDHLIPLALGGSNSIKNLWPQPHHTSSWNAPAKDRLEMRLLKLVCSGQVDLETAQREMATDWTQAYQRFIGVRPPAVPKREPPPSATETKVWVNTRSGVYWKPRSQFFGNTKHGKFMTERDAVEAGYRPARGSGS